MAESPPPNKRAKLAFQETFDVLVGEEPNQQLFPLHNEKFIPRSKLFKSARSKRWSTKPTTLPDDNPEVFSAYVAAVYNNELPKRMVFSDRNDDASDHTTGLQLPIHLYILADKLRDLKTANMAIDHIIRVSDEFQTIPSYELSNFIFDHLLVGKPLRKLIVDYTLHENHVNDTLAEASSEMLIEMVREAQRVMHCARHSKSTDGLSQKASERRRCYYHQHDKDNPESECK